MHYTLIIVVTILATILATITATLIALIHLPWKIQWLNMTSRARSWLSKRGMVDYDLHCKEKIQLEVKIENLDMKSSFLRTQLEDLLGIMVRDTVDISHLRVGSPYIQKGYFPGDNDVSVLHFEAFTVRCRMPPLSKDTVTSYIAKESIAEMFTEAGREYAKQIVGDCNARYKS